MSRLSVQTAHSPAIDGFVAVLTVKITSRPKSSVFPLVADLLYVDFVPSAAFATISSVPSCMVALPLLLGALLTLI